MNNSLILIGHGNYMPLNKIMAILNIGSRSIKGLISKAEINNKLIDATKGKKTKTVILSTDDFVVLSSFNPDTLAKRCKKEDVVSVLHIGGENFVLMNRVLAILEKKSNPISEMVKLARVQDKVINSQSGRVARCYVLTDSGYFFVSFFPTSTLAKRFNKETKVLQIDNDIDIK